MNPTIDNNGDEVPTEGVIAQLRASRAELGWELARVTAERDNFKAECRSLIERSERLETGVHSCHENCPRVRCVERRKIRQLESDLAEAVKYAEFVREKFAGIDAKTDWRSREPEWWLVFNEVDREAARLVEKHRTRPVTPNAAGAAESGMM